jgi:hypothetical protein
MGLTYILDGHTPVLIDDIHAWAQWFETSDAERIVAQTTVGDVQISTVFLGIDYNYRPHGAPVLFETMAFLLGSRSEIADLPVLRYATWAMAQRGHARVVNMAKSRLPAEVDAIAKPPPLR